MRPADRKYLKSHEWCKVEKGTATIGITDYAVSHLSDLVFLDLPAKGSSVTAGESFGEIESVKAVSDLYAPLNGEVAAVNKAVADDPASIAADPFGKGWLIKIKPEPGFALDGMLSLAEYEKQIAEEEH